MGNKIFCLSSLKGATLCLLVNLPRVNCLSQFSSQILRLDIKNENNPSKQVKHSMLKKDSNIDVPVYKDTV
jgi:hypothetical protein